MTRAEHFSPSHRAGHGRTGAPPAPSDRGHVCAAVPAGARSPRRDVAAAAFPRLSSAQTDYFNPRMSLRGHLFMFTVGEGGRGKHSSSVPHSGRSSPTAPAAPAPWERGLEAVPGSAHPVQVQPVGIKQYFCPSRSPFVAVRLVGSGSDLRAFGEPVLEGRLCQQLGHDLFASSRSGSTATSGQGMGLEPPAPSWGLSPPPALVWLTKASPAGAASCGTIAWPPACSLPQGRTEISGRETHTDPAGVAAQPRCTPQGWERFVGRANIPAVPQPLHQGHARGRLRQPPAPQIPNPPLRAQKASSAQK